MFQSKYGLGMYLNQYINRMEPKKRSNKRIWRFGWNYIMLESKAAVSASGNSEGGWSRTYGWIQLDMRIAAMT